MVLMIPFSVYFMVTFSAMAQKIGSYINISISRVYVGTCRQQFTLIRWQPNYVFFHNVVNLVAKQPLQQPQLSLFLKPIRRPRQSNLDTNLQPSNTLI